jgi:hypothetical protein
MPSVLNRAFSIMMRLSKLPSPTKPKMPHKDKSHSNKISIPKELRLAANGRSLISHNEFTSITHVAMKNGATIEQLQPLFSDVINNQAIPTAKRASLATKFCDFPHTPEEVALTLDTIEASSLKRVPTALNLLNSNVPATVEHLDLVLRMALSKVGADKCLSPAIIKIGKMVATDPSIILPIDDIRDVVIAELEREKPSTTGHPALVRALCLLPHDPEQANETIRKIGEINNEVLSTSFEKTLSVALDRLAPQLRFAKEDNPDTLTQLILTPYATPTSASSIILSMIKRDIHISDEIIMKVKDGFPLSKLGYSQLVHWLRTHEGSEHLQEVLTHARANHPDVSAFTFLQIARNSDDQHVSNLEDVFGKIVQNKSFLVHMQAIYGDSAPLLPSISRSAHDALFAANAEPTQADQAQVFVSFAQMIIVQLQRLPGLVMGQERETTALHEWGSSSFQDWQNRSIAPSNVARLLLVCALELEPRCSSALAAMANLQTILGSYKDAAESLEARLSIPEQNLLVLRQYLKTLCQVDRQGEAAVMASSTLKPGSSYEAANYVNEADFSACVGIPRRLPVENSDINFQAVRDHEVKAFTQPVQFQPIAFQKLEDVRLVGNTQLVGPHNDALAYDHRFEVVQLPTSGKDDGQGMSFCGKTGFIFDSAVESVTISNPTAMMVGLPPMYQSYYHAVVQNLARLPWLIEQGLLADRKLALPDTLPNWAMQMVHDFGVPEDQTLLLDQDTIYHFQDLLIPTPASMTGAVNPTVIESARRHLGVKKHKAPLDGRRIFWSRASANNVQRSLMNEHELIKIAVDAGFEIVDPVGMSVAEQIETLSSASIVIGATGGAFANLLFAPSGLRAICFAPRQSAKNYYPLLADACGQDFVWVLGEYVQEGYHGVGFPHLPFQVNAESFRAGLEALGICSNARAGYSAAST